MASPVSGSTSWYLMEEEPELITRTEDEDTRSPFVLWGIGKKKYEAGARFVSILTGPRDLGPVQPWAWTAVRATVLTMSSTRAPRDRSLTGLLRPWRMGPTASAPEERWTAL